VQQGVDHLQVQRGEHDLDPLQVRLETEDVHPAAAGAAQLDGLAPERLGDPVDQGGRGVGVRALDVELEVRQLVRPGIFRRQHGPLDAVLGHQLGGLGGQRLRLLAGAAFGLGLGQQRPDLVQLLGLRGGGGVGHLGPFRGPGPDPLSEPIGQT
jgi:hypothetical protein